MWVGSMFRLADGVIVGSMTAPSREFVEVDFEFDLIEGVHDGATYHVVDGEVVERATMTPSVSLATIDADGEDESVVSGLPDPCTVQLRGVVTAGPTTVTGGSVTITSTVPGTITVRVTSEPTHKAWETTINAV